MDNKTKKLVIQHYNEGCSLRKISELINGDYGRESIRKELKSAGIILRGRGMVYKDHKDFTSDELKKFAELLGYFYGDGSLSRYKNTKHGIYKANLTFSLNEGDLVWRTIEITYGLFNFEPKVQKKESIYIIKFRSTFANYLNSIGYPCGKKSEINPHIPLRLLNGGGMKRGFVCGFLNAEASVNKTIAVQQSVRVKLKQETINSIKEENKVYYINRQKCYLIKWSKVKDKVRVEDIRKSNMLVDLKSIFEEFGIDSKIYPLRLYIGKNDKTSIHFELRIPLNYIRLVKEAGMISCNKKLNKIYNLMRECRSGQIRLVSPILGLTG